MPDLYREIRDDLKYVADTLEDYHFDYKSYNKGVQFNVKDLSGITHTYYPTTGTIILHASNDRKDHRMATFRDKSLDDFMECMKRPKAIQKYFEREDK